MLNLNDEYAVYSYELGFKMCKDGYRESPTCCHYYWLGYQSANK